MPAMRCTAGIKASGSRFTFQRLVPEISQAIANGQRLQELLSEAGVRYATALKAKRKKEREP